MKDKYSAILKGREHSDKKLRVRALPFKYTSRYIYRGADKSLARPGRK